MAVGSGSDAVMQIASSARLVIVDFELDLGVVTIGQVVRALKQVALLTKATPAFSVGGVRLSSKAAGWIALIQDTERGRTTPLPVIRG